MASPPSSRDRYDPTFVHARREAVVILVVWALCLVWTIGYSSVFAYQADSAGKSLVFGLPGWVFWGVAVPWAVAAVVSIGMALVYMADDDLGEES